jgi:hypothetical protein
VIVELFQAAQHLRAAVRLPPDLAHAVRAGQVKPVFADGLAGMVQQRISLAAKQFSNTINIMSRDWSSREYHRGLLKNIPQNYAYYSTRLSGILLAMSNL